MPNTPSDAVSQALSRVAASSRSSTAYYGNTRGLPGSSVRPVRLMSNIGFPNDRSFSYVPPAQSLVIPHDPPRSVTSFTLHPYGLDDDARRLTSTNNVDRRIRSAYGETLTGIRTYPGNAAIYIAADVDDNTYAPTKTARLINALVSSQHGPAFHFVITRNGDMLVVAPLDGETSASIDNTDVTVDIALEGAFAMRRNDHDQSNFSGTLVEIPYTGIQLAVLSVLIVKLRTAYPSVPLDLVNGILYDWRNQNWHDAPQFNFSSGSWINVSIFDHTTSDAPAFFTNVNLIEPFDLATDIFQSNQAPPPVATRAIAQTAIGQADTVGNQSVLLANYATLAGPERANDMQSSPRISFFVERTNRAATDGDSTSAAAADVSASGQVNPLEAATGTDPFTYDYTTGRWSDNGQAF